MDVGRPKPSKIAILKRPRQPFARNGRWTSKTEEKCDFEASGATLSHEMDVGHQKMRKLQLLLVARNPFARNGR